MQPASGNETLIATTHINYITKLVPGNNKMSYYLRDLIQQLI